MSPVSKLIQSGVTMTNFLQPMNHFVDEFEIECQPDGKTYTVSIRTSEEAVVRAVEVLHFVLGCSSRIMRAMANTTSQVKAKAVVQLRQAQHKALAQSYYDYRARGHKHRAAIACVLESDLAKRLNYTKTEIYQCVRAHQDQVAVLEHVKKETSHAPVCL